MRAAPRAASAWPSDANPSRPVGLQRLLSRAQFRAVLDGQTVARTAHFALHRLALSGLEPGVSGLFAAPGPWIGAVVPKRWARRAVTRNAIKRQIYAMSQADLDSAEPAALVVRLRSGFDRALFPSASSDALRQAVRAELAELLGLMPARAPRS